MNAVSVEPGVNLTSVTLSFSPTPTTLACPHCTHPLLPVALAATMPGHWVVCGHCAREWEIEVFDTED